MNILQAKLIVMALELEIKTMARGTKMQMTREPAMKSLERLTGIDTYGSFGKGLRGRQKALEWLQDCLADPANQHEGF